MDTIESKRIVFTEHAKQRMRERGASEEDVVDAIRRGEREPAQRGLVMFRHNVDFRNEWMGRFWGIQQIAPIIAEEPDRMVVVTVYTFYFKEYLPS